jgi:bifunctional UDP-N-acetylglucosamine pyrophosphorylase/glucosamine-1-phosphate N-acetyltransferase
MFVAPVTVGDGAYTGAGTVVREDVPPGALAVSAGPQRNIEGHADRKRQAAGQADTDRGVDPEVGPSSPGGRES